MKILTMIIRLLLGLVFVFFGANGFLRFLPMPPLPQGLVGEFIHVFFASGYIYAVAGCQVIGGILLLIGRFVPLGLTILGPVIVNIVVFHLLLAREGLALAIVIALLFSFLLLALLVGFRATISPKRSGFLASSFYSRALRAVTYRQSIDSRRERLRLDDRRSAFVVKAGANPGNTGGTD